MQNYWKCKRNYQFSKSSLAQKRKLKYGQFKIRFLVILSHFCAEHFDGNSGDYYLSIGKEIKAIMLIFRFWFLGVVTIQAPTDLGPSASKLNQKAGPLDGPFRPLVSRKHVFKTFRPEPSITLRIRFSNKINALSDKCDTLYIISIFPE